MTGLLALHGGGEYVAGDEVAMDALVAAALGAAANDGTRVVPRIAVVPTAAARGRPSLAAANGERSFAAAAARAGVRIEVGTVPVLARADASDPRLVGPLESAHLVHFPGGDPDVIPAVFAGSAGWSAIERAHAAGCVVAGASAGAMAMAERCWTRDGAVPGLGLVPGFAVLPHFAPGRLRGWRAAVERDGAPVSWLGIEEQTLVIGRPAGEWRVAGRGLAHLIDAGGVELASAANGERIDLR